jgi:sugar lactone lactonase YvrE
MALVLINRAQETATANTTVSFTLLGANTGYQTLAGVGNTNTTYYGATDGTNWEVGIGTYSTTGPTLTRTTILSSSNSNAAVSTFTSPLSVFVDYPAEKSVYEDASNIVTVPTLAIDTSGTDAQIAPTTGIAGWNYSGLSKSIGTEETAPTGLFISPDGLNMYVNGTTGDDVNQYTLSTAWNVSTATFVRLFSTSAQDSAPQDIFFKPDGLSMFIMGNTNDTVFQYTLSSAFDISTATYASKSFSVASQETTPNGLWFKPDGTVMYIVGSTSDTVFQYTLGTAWDVSTASYASISFVVSQESSPTQVNLSADGLTMWITGSTGDDINEYSLGTAWNVSTATFVNNFYIGFQDTGPNGLFIDSTANNRVYIVGSTNDTVFQYNTATNSISAVTDVFNTTSNARVQGNLAVQGSAVIDAALIAGNLTVGTTSISGTLTATSTITLQGTTTSTIALGTSVTSGTISVGGTSGTGTITVGQSTVSQTTNIQAGATASGSTKTMNIGTAGVSGSTTAINIGSAVSGSLGTTTIQAPTVNIGQTATQFQVTNTASAVNFVQTTGSLTGFGAKLLSAGTDTNIPLVLQPKGTGALQAQQTDSTTAGGNVRGSYAVDWQTIRGAASQVASGTYATLGGGINNTVGGFGAIIAGGGVNTASATYAAIGGGQSNNAGSYSYIGSGQSNTGSGLYNFIGGGFTNAGTSGSAVTTQSGTMNGTTAVTLSGSNANIKVGQYISGTSIAADTYVAAISGTSLTLSKVASGSSTSTLSFFTPHGVVVGGGNNQATGAYSAILGGGDAGTAANRNVASGDYSVVVGGRGNQATAIGSFVGGGGLDGGSSALGSTASGLVSFVGGGLSNQATSTGASILGGYQNIANATLSSVIGGRYATTRSISGNMAFAACNIPITSASGVSQAAILILARQTTDATATALASDSAAAGTGNQVILPNNSAYLFKATVISNVTGGGNTSAWKLEGAIKRGANAAATSIVGSVTTTLLAQDAGAATWAIAATADTTNGGLRITFTGQASTTIRTVAKLETTEVTY